MAIYKDTKLKKKSPVPMGWLHFSNIGNVVKNTRIVAFKVPLSLTEDQMLTEGLLHTGKRFNLDDLFESSIGRKLGLVIDLTASLPLTYYDSSDVNSRGVEYKNIKTRGMMIPSQAVVTDFKETVDDFLQRNQGNGKLVGVHCTHGVNRSGYIICRYLIDRLGMTADGAITAFQSARGHAIERLNYLQSLRCGDGQDDFVNPDNECDY